MCAQRLDNETAALARRYDDGDRQVLVVDLGVRDESVSVDVVDDTVVLVVTGETDDQYELDAPAGDVTRAFINNGVVTIEVEP